MHLHFHTHLPVSWARLFHQPHYAWVWLRILLARWHWRAHPVTTEPKLRPVQPPMHPNQIKGAASINNIIQRCRARKFTGHGLVTVTVSELAPLHNAVDIMAP